MRLLFDENLSPKLVRTLSETYPDSAHVRDVELSSASDNRVWEFARDHDFIIIIIE